MESQPLLHETASRDRLRIAPKRVLPVPLFAALAMASSSATAYFAYATLLCKTPTQCQKDEVRRYTGLVAAATSAANLLGVATLGALQALLTRHQQFGLLLWLGIRSMSTVMLLSGVSIQSISAALSGRIFEGLASDNLLHFLLNSIYVRDPDNTSTLFAWSLALYLIGISIGPFFVALLRNFTASLSVALGLFAITALYISIFARVRAMPQSAPDQLTTDERSAREAEVLRPVAPPTLSKQQTVTFWAPLKPFVDRPALLFFAGSVFCFNSTQSYIFDALLIHTTVRFGFTNRDHGFLISIAHSIASTYIFIASVLLKKAAISQPTRDASQCLFSMAMQVISLFGFGLASRPSHVYGMTALISFGLPAPSFIKAYFVSKLHQEERVPGLAFLVAMEALASVIGPIAIGKWQGISSGDGSVFFGAATLVGFAAVLFGLGAACFHEDMRPRNLQT